jgi:hypothetical protein
MTIMSLVCGSARTGDPPLAAVDDPLLAIALDARLDVRGVGGGDVRLGHDEGRADLTVEQRDEPAVLLLVGAEHGEQLHVAGVRRGAVQRLGRDVAAAGQLGQGRIVEVVEAVRPLGLVRQEEVPQAEVARLGLQLLHDRRTVMRVPGVGDRLLVGVLGGEHLVAHERGEPVVEGLGGVAQLKVHGCVTSVLRDRG